MAARYLEGRDGKKAPADPHPTRFRLDGPSIALDPRVHAFRPDIADLALAGQVFASHYARPETWRCANPSNMIHGNPSVEATATSQLLHGEEFAVIDINGGWAWGYSRHDHYVGYTPIAGLSKGRSSPTHMVTAPAALVFAEPDFKAPLVARLPIGARIAAVEIADNGFIGAGDGWIHPRHLSGINMTAADPVAVTERLLGMPYLWGGRGGDGIDCSGLVQIALGLCGTYAPRDSDQQLNTLGEPVETGALRRGDLVFFPGHVGWMVDEERLIHASAHWMQVITEPLSDVERLLKAGHDKPVIAIKRL